MKSLLSVVVVSAALALPGCATFEPEPVELPLPLPEQWHLGGTDTTPAMDTRWWQAFGDPVLVSLVEQALEHNPDLAATAEAVIQADLQLRNAGASLLPEVGGSGSTGKQVSRRDGTTSNAGSTRLGLDISYEVDLWGRLRASEASAAATLAATRYDLSGARLTLVASVASTWFQLLDARERLQVAERNLDIARRTLTLVAARHRLGAADRSELARQRTEVLSRENVIPPLRYQVQAREAALQVLTGRMPYQQALPEAGLMAVSVPAIASGLPAEVIRQRPDIAAVEARLQAASADVAVARAALLPSLSLSGAVTLTNTSLLSLADPVTGANGLLSLAQTLFDGGRRENAVALSRSRQVALLAQYRSALLTAVQEVGDAQERVALYRGQELRLEGIREQAEEALRLTEVRYREGADDLLTLLSAQESVFSVRSQLSQARLERLQAAVDLYKALGRWPEAPAALAGG